MEKRLYTPSPNNIQEFLEKLRTIAVPPKVSQSFLKTIGFTSSNDRYIIGVLKSLGFIDANGVPQQGWKDFRDRAKAPSAMASSIKSTYSELFDIYPDAPTRDASEIQNFFSTRLNVATATAQYMERSFRILCAFADFGAMPTTAGVAEPAVPSVEKVVEAAAGTREPTVNINIQLQLPATENADIYDSLFAALKKHLFS